MQKKVTPDENTVISELESISDHPPQIFTVTLRTHEIRTPAHASVHTGIPASLDSAVSYRWMHPLADNT